MKDKTVLLGPPPFVTIIPTIPILRAGVVKVIVVLLITLKDVTTVPPIVTTLAPVKYVPVIVILVPPSVLPNDGEMLLILGGII